MALRELAGTDATHAGHFLFGIVRVFAPSTQVDVAEAHFKKALLGHKRATSGTRNTVSPTAGIDDHVLDIYAILAGPLREHVNIARLLKDGSFIEHDRVHHLTSRCPRSPALRMRGSDGFDRLNHRDRRT
ncbi:MULTISPECIES: hypothetical protein [unclassified Pseudarthrobacter]|uniref:hypothetical protein n=1 Tax=unclassified Pseudarthrobacter TaxID=2647000 RepID=UPI003CC69A94